MDNGLITMERKSLILGGSDNPAIYAAAVRSAEEVKVAYQVANYRPRNIQQARQSLVDVCGRPSFAPLIEWEKPAAGKKIKGVTIRLMEEAIKAYTNIQVTKTTVYEDAVNRKVVVKVIDLENNISYEDESVIRKTVERSNAGDRVVISQRQNSKGEATYLVEATEDEMLGKTNAQVSKMIRTLAKRLIPADLIEDGLDKARKTMRNADAVDPKTASNKIFDSFKGLGITPDMIAIYVGSNKAIFTLDELESLRGLYAALKEKETTWKEVVDGLQKNGDKNDKKKSTLEKKAEDAKGNKGIDDHAVNSTELTAAQKGIAELPRSLANTAIAALGINKQVGELTDAECVAISKKVSALADEEAER